MNYTDFINFNQNITELKGSNDSIKLIKHSINNKDRATDKELINKNPEIKQITLKEANLKKIEKELEETKKLKQGGKGAKPFRFITTTLNVEPNKENEELIKEWGNEMYKLYSKYFNIEACYLHTNETRPHLHITAKNFNDKDWGNYVNGKKIKLSGPEGKALLKKLWKEGEEINVRLAEKYKKNFKQEATTEKGRDRTIQRFRALDQQTAKPEDLKKLALFLKDKGLIKEPSLKITNEIKDQVIKSWGKKGHDGKFISIDQQLKENTLNKQQAETYKKLAEQYKTELEKERTGKKTPAEDQLLNIVEQLTGTKNIVEQRNRLLAMYEDYTKLIEKEEQRKYKEQQRHRTGPTR